MTISTTLRTSRTLIRLPEPDDVQRLLSFRIENRAHFAPWEPQRTADYYQWEQCARTVADSNELARSDRQYSFLVFSNQQHKELVGFFTYSNVVRGVFQACNLGYGMGARWQGQGLLSEALDAGQAWAFGELGLHRIMANYMPCNTRSEGLLNRLGFEREGYARKYLQIAGQWEDHVLTAKIRDDG